MSNTYRLVLILALLSLAPAKPAGAQVLEIDWYTIDCGGAMFTTGGPYELSGTIGQSDAGVLSGGAFELAGGFWPMVTLGPPCVADFNNDGLLDFFDVQMFLGLFAASDPAADLNNDSLFDFFDVQTFLGLFAAGCP
jgi:hypothetical protein